ncbi:classical arabinogalactan protein 26 [Spinacia oleracea]|uniref:Classical arabinogalactan protein 26 n=1 Tax=Spinacia oleracea TaxID=3562 RepID=A0A9R0KCR6_SPIOL|nr:classical arabinogalactan protein 26 [Spinacia oleracea]
MASLNHPKLLLNLIIILYITCCNSYTGSASHKTTTFKLSTIAAEPSILPYDSPALSPDITPLFPTTPTSVSNPPSSESTLPIIPSSPSPPNPDSLSTPYPDSSLPSSISPTGSMIPESSAFAMKLSVILNSAMVVLLLIAFW